ncbi:MAG: HlyD family efflux transporter periplasmic adaptor subunit [Leptolyngbya sp. Prado105]|nr:HlyD family efflux transporter periplasmic adaptor subunit [Leptolyngbya sp. Prado105]
MYQDPQGELLPLIHSDEFLPSISRWIKGGGFVLLGAIAATLALASTTHYNVTVKASATVRPTGELRLVQAASEGTIAQISVQENQPIKAGEPIAILNDSELQTRRQELQASLQQSQAELAQIQAQINTLATQIIAETHARDRAVASAQADLNLVQRQYLDERLTTQARLTEAQASLEFAQQERDRYQQLSDSGVISSSQISQKEQAFKIAEAKLEQARIALNPSNAAIAAAQERIAQEQSRGTATSAALNRERESLVQHQIQVQNQINKTHSDLQQLNIALSKSTIRASVDGIIINLNLRNPGQVVRSGEAIAQIAPANIPFVINAYVTAQDIGKVEVGQAVQLRVSAYPYPDYGTLKGTVTAIAPDATAPKTESPSVSGTAAYYQVTVTPERPYLVRGDRRYPIQAGMEARADIISREETALTFVLRKARLITDL